MLLQNSHSKTFYKLQECKYVKAILSKVGGSYNKTTFKIFSREFGNVSEELATISQNIFMVDFQKRNLGWGITKTADSKAALEATMLKYFCSKVAGCHNRKRHESLPGNFENISEGLLFHTVFGQFFGIVNSMTTPLQWKNNLT